jgi:cytoskeletal protein RodZ
VFNRGFVRAYCKAIGLDPESMVNAYLLEEQSRVEPALRDEPVLRRGTHAGTAGERTPRVRPAESRPPVAWYRWVLLLLAMIASMAALYVYLSRATARSGSLSSSAAGLASSSEGARS